eukprot:6213937-Pleurochrysis_carterae.AAC.2
MSRVVVRALAQALVPHRLFRSECDIGDADSTAANTAAYPFFVHSVLSRLQAAAQGGRSVQLF